MGNEASGKQYFRRVFLGPLRLGSPFCLENHEQRKKKNIVGMLDVEYLLAADVDEELAELLDAPLPALIYELALLIQRFEQSLQD